MSRPRASSPSSATQWTTRLLSVLLLALATFCVAARASRAEIVIAHGAVTMHARQNPLPSLTLADIVAKHVAFPKEELAEELLDDVRDACSSLQGPTCGALGAMASTADVDNGSLSRADTMVVPQAGRRSRVKVVRLDNVEDLVTYFHKHHVTASGDDGVKITADFSREGADMGKAEGDMDSDGGGARTTHESIESLFSNLERQSRADASAEAVRGGGAFDATVKSVPGLARRRVSFYNSKARLVSVYWVNFDGQEVHYVDVHPKENGVVHTFQRHVWIARDYETNAFITQFVVGDDGTKPQRFIVV